MSTTQQQVMPLEEVKLQLSKMLGWGENSLDEQRALRAALHHLEAGRKPVQCDGQEFGSSGDAALHLLWILQRLSFFEPEREGQPCDGARFRQCILEARKLLSSLDYESVVFRSVPPTVQTTEEVKG